MTRCQMGSRLTLIIPSRIQKVRQMTNGSLPPTGCSWWRPGDPTRNPPTDELFLRELAEAGFATYIGPIGLMGADTVNRSIIVIHRGMGRRWEVTLREDEVERHITKVTALPEQAAAAIAWLGGESLEKVRQLLRHEGNGVAGKSRISNRSLGR
jgi:hypothetical protein